MNKKTYRMLITILALCLPLLLLQSTGANREGDPGNSTGPPDSVPEYMAVIVSSSITKSGSAISGNNRKMVVVKTEAGYDSNPGHAGTGTVVAVICQ